MDRTLTLDEARAIQSKLTQEGALVMWTVTYNTTDYPGMVVARPHRVGRQGSAAMTAVVVARTVEAVRACLPPGLTCFPRELADDLVIVETWF